MTKAEAKKIVVGMEDLINAGDGCYHGADAKIKYVTKTEIVAKVTLHFDGKDETYHCAEYPLNSIKEYLKKKGEKVNGMAGF